MFYHSGRDLAGVVHGDDFTFCGCQGDLDWMSQRMKSWFEIKVRAVLGPEESDDKEVVILGRIVKWTQEGIEYKADPKHRAVLLEKFGFREGETRALANNGEKDWREEKEFDLEFVDAEEAKEFRGCAARINFLSLDCPDLQFVSKEISRDMASPRRGAWRRMKKTVRYLFKFQRGCLVFLDTKMSQRVWRFIATAIGEDIGEAVSLRVEVVLCLVVIA